MSFAASNIITYLVIGLLDRKMSMQAIRSHDIAYFGCVDMMSSVTVEECGWILSDYPAFIVFGVNLESSIKKRRTR